MAQEPHVTRLPTAKLFIDGVKEVIFFGENRVEHGREGPGYQRDPYKRIPWLKHRSAIFNQALLRPIEVSRRADGKYAIIDGGGRWVMAQELGITELECRVHEGLTREQEADLFVKFDREIYRVRQVEQFHAALAAGNPTVVAIDDAIKPHYDVGKSGPRNLDSPSTLLQIFGLGGEGERVLRKTALICANSWTKSHIGAAPFAAIAMLVDTAPAGWNEGVLRDIMKRSDCTPTKLEAKARTGGKEDKSKALFDVAVTVSLMLAKRYNVAIKNKGKHFDTRDIKSCDVCDRMSAVGGSRIAFGNILSAKLPAEASA